MRLSRAAVLAWAVCLPLGFLAASCSTSSRSSTTTSKTPTSNRTSAFSGSVIYTVSRANSNNLKAYREGTWSLLGEWTVPALRASAYTRSFLTTARGTAYDKGTLFIATGNYRPQISGVAGQVVAWDLVDDKQLWDRRFTTPVDQLAACNGYIYLPTGEGSTGATWVVLRESNGATLGSIDGPTPGPHNTICARDASGHYHVFMGGRCLVGTCASYLGQETCSGATCTKQVDVGPQPAGAGSGVRPFAVGDGLTRAWITWTHYRGFSVANLATGQILASINFGPYSTGACSNLSAQSHGISVSPDRSQVYVLDAPAHTVRVYDGSDNPKSIANINIDNFCGAEESSMYCGGPDCSPDGWLQHTLDGSYVLVGGSGDVINTATRTLAVSSASTGSAKSLYTDLRNNEHGFIDINWSGGVPAAGSHFGIGR